MSGATGWGGGGVPGTPEHIIGDLAAAWGDSHIKGVGMGQETRGQVGGNEPRSKAMGNLWKVGELREDFQGRTLGGSLRKMLASNLPFATPVVKTILFSEVCAICSNI